MKFVFKHLKIILILIVLLVFVEQSQAEEVYKLSLKQATELALLNNFDIQLAKYDAWIAGTDNTQAKSIYDTVIEAEVEYQNNQSARTSTIFGTKVADNDYNVGVSKKLPSGTSVSFDLDNSRSSTNSAFASSPLTHDSTLGVTIAQELGRNFFGLEDRGGIKITRLDVQNKEYTSLDKIESGIAAVQTAYWDLVLAAERVAIERDMLAQAKRLYDLHQEKLKDGLVELPEALASEANYKQRQNELLLVQNDVKEKSNALRLLLNITEDNLEIKASDTFGTGSGINRLDASLKQAFDHRRDYKAIRNDIESKNIQLAIKKNNMWPQIDLTASLNRNGLGDHFKQSVTNITREDNPNFFAGLSISFPLENREARAQLKAAQYEKARELVRLKSIERKILIEVTDMVRNCNVYQEIARNSQHVAQLQARKLKEEEKKYYVGRSDTDIIIRFQEDLIQARARAAQDKHLYHTALIDLDVKRGLLLNRYWKDEL